MSGFAAVFGQLAHDAQTGALRRMQGAMHARGEASGVWRDDHAVLGAVRHAWEVESAGADAVAVASNLRYVVAADATLYYKAELAATLARAGFPPRDESVGELLLAAYAAWGADCAARLEGDFAFVVWDRTTRTAYCARDFSGTRTLYHALVGNLLVVASTVGAVLAYPGCPAELNLAHVASTVAGLHADESSTAYVSVRALPPGSYLARSHDAVPRIRRYWEPPVVESAASMNFLDAAVHLRELLSRATAERFAASGPTAVALSGGYDSTAIYGAGKQVLRERGRAGDLRAVSMSYPEGDPGREDELIAQVARFWDSPVHWLDIGDAPLVDPASSRADRDEPFVHTFESMNRALMRGARDVGARVAFVGRGGDELFQVSVCYFADLLRQGKWLTLARDWSARGAYGWYTFFRYAVVPRLGPTALRALGWLRGGRSIASHLETVMPAWIDAGFARREELVERERASAPTRGALSASAFETRWMLTYGFFSRVHSTLYDLALESGVEVRWPLYDRRVVEFAASRPRWERASGAETKRLLRGAMRGLLPESLLAPRKYRTGTTGRYFEQGFGAVAPVLFRELMGRPMLAELGIVEADAFRRACDRFLAGDTSDATALFTAVKTEQWLRAKLLGPSATRPAWREDAQPLLSVV